MKPVLDNCTIEDLKKGFHYDPATRHYTCLACQANFVQGTIYPEEDALVDAETAVTNHVRAHHGSPLEHLLGLDKRYTGLTDLQRQILTRFYQGATDRDVADDLDIGSTSTVRNHRFNLRERHKQARVFVAVMELVEDRLAQTKSSPTAPEKEGEPLKALPRRRKKQIALFEEAAARFVPGRYYTEREVNVMLKPICEDVATMRRLMIGHGYMERERDGSRYWLAGSLDTKEDEMNRKDLKRAYKETPRPAGIYQIRNTVNGKILVESALDIEGSRNRFHFEQRHGTIRHNAALKEDWATHGPESFTFEVLEQIKPKSDPQHDYRDELDKLEKTWLAKLQPYGDQGYNRPPKPTEN